MPEDEVMYNALLKHSDGTETLMPVPGVENEKGHVWVPETITLSSGKIFLLNRKVDEPTYFEYKEIVKPKIPFREDLH